MADYLFCGVLKFNLYFDTKKGENMRVKVATALIGILILTGCAPKNETVEPTETKQTNKEPIKKEEGQKIVRTDGTVPDGVIKTNSSEIDNENQNNNQELQNQIDASSNNQVISSITQLSIYFDFDKYNIRSDMQKNIDMGYNFIKNDSLNVIVEGNCDEWGSDEYNYALGLKRAKTVKDTLNRMGIENKQMSLISYGESNPVCQEHNENCWGKNRRVEFKIR